ncbi:MAG: YiiX/YebB-like N1pC/P60 family cysteine hydrolase, partial [Candidatus Dadabacteria bacterium]
MSKILLFMLITATIVASIGHTPASSKDVYSRSLEMIQTGEKIIREGDLVVRNHYEFTSSLIKTFNRRDKSYSHAGIVFMENGYPYIYHITDGGKDALGGIRKDSLKVFCTPNSNGGYGIFRYNFTSMELDSMKSLLREWVSKDMKFDFRMDYQTDEKMYCSEMIAKLISRGTCDRIVIDRTRPTQIERFLFNKMYDLPKDYGKGKTVVAIDNLYLNP